MGQLIDGVWREGGIDTRKTGGHFKRADAQFRSFVRRGDVTHPVAAGRYHLYVAMACPWAHRTLIYRSLFGLEDAVSVTRVDSDMLTQGWELKDDPDPLFGARYLHEIYSKADPTFSGRVTVPVLWDRERATVVNNESSEIIRMFSEEFAPELETSTLEVRPVELREEIDAINERVYREINNGVYMCGFASKQEAYDGAVKKLFDALDWLEELLEGKTYLVGERLTEADLRLFTTLVRFDPVYNVHFKCCKRRLVDYPNLWALTRRIYQTEKVRDTVDMTAIRRHYFYSHESINPHRIVPIRPIADLDARC